MKVCGTPGGVPAGTVLLSRGRWRAPVDGNRQRKGASRQSTSNATSSSGGRGKECCAASVGEGGEDNRAVGQGSLKKQKAVSLTAAAAHTMNIRPLLPVFIIIFSGAQHHHASVLIIGTLL